jgi:N-carbamoyl-L-amino-acid hydrolase
MEERLLEAVPQIATACKVEASVRKVWDSPAVRFAPDCVSAVRAAVQKLGLPAREIVSGAGHDAAYIARIAPTTMIFVPCAGGLSHNEAESTSFEECSAGAQVLLNAVMEYDQRFSDSQIGGHLNDS